jgi:hypothetical protein
MRAAAYGRIVRRAAMDGFGLHKVLTADRLNAITAPLGSILLSDLRLAEVLNLQVADEQRWGELVSSIAPSCRQELLFQGFVIGS